MITITMRVNREEGANRNALARVRQKKAFADLHELFEKTVLYSSYLSTSECVFSTS